MEDLSKYIINTFGVEAKFAKLENHKLAEIPLYLKSSYELHNGWLAGRHIVWAKVVENESITPDQLQKQSTQLKKYLHAPIVFVFSQLESWQRKRLIEKHIAFAQPFKQLYIPDILLQLNDIARYQPNGETIADKLTAPAQSAILYHLQVRSLENKPFQEIAGLLNYSAMTVTRLVKELKNFKLLSIEGSKEKSVKFNLKGKELWEKVLPYLTSPVREIWFTDSNNFNYDQFRATGDTALAAYTMLSETGQKSYAIGKDEFRSMKTLGTLKGLDKKNGKNRIEVWLYNPSILSSEKEVDKLSLYLSMQHENDERVLKALHDLINEFKW